MPSAGVYLHIPFCKSRCSYCDFATDVYRDSGAVERYVEALCREIGEMGKLAREQGRYGQADSTALAHARACATDGGTPSAPVDTVYFGGGTPSLLSPDQVERILGVVRSKFDVAADAEITMEMNPATVTAESLAAYRDLGVNRASFGVQTFNERDLKLLARGHDSNDARTTYRLLREAGFDNVSFDLIGGLPGQTMDDWRRNLDEAVAMRPEHLSLYLLEVHEGTPLAEQLRSGRRPMPDEDLAAEMYETMIDTLSAAGYEQYEISNFALLGYESRHNTKYWRLEPVYGFGVSAHSFDGNERYSNERDTARYVEKIEGVGSAEVSRERIDETSEAAFLGLRLSEGLDVEDYRTRFGVDLAARTEQMREDGLLDLSEGRLRLTRRGMLYSNEIFSTFV